MQNSIICYYDECRFLWTFGLISSLENLSANFSPCGLFAISRNASENFGFICSDSMCNCVCNVFAYLNFILEDFLFQTTTNSLNWSDPTASLTDKVFLALQTGTAGMRGGRGNKPWNLATMNFSFSTMWITQSCTSAMSESLLTRHERFCWFETLKFYIRSSHYVSSPFPYYLDIIFRLCRHEATSEGHHCLGDGRPCNAASDVWNERFTQLHCWRRAKMTFAWNVWLERTEVVHDRTRRSSSLRQKRVQHLVPE